jgi:hypothetical protein
LSLLCLRFSGQIRNQLIQNSDLLISHYFRMYYRTSWKVAYGRMTLWGDFKACHHTRFCQVNTTIWSHSKRFKHQRCYCCMSVSLNLKTMKSKPICVKCRLLKDDHYYLRTKAASGLVFRRGSVQHEVPFELMSLSMAESFWFRKSVLHHWNIFAGCYGSERTCLLGRDISEVCTRLPKLQ